MVDPAERYDKVREEKGEVAAAKAVISLSKRVVTGAVALVALFLFGGLFLLLYGQGRVSSCRDVVESNFEAGLGAVIVEYRATGGLSDETFQQFTDTLIDNANVDSICENAFWPWDLPSDPSSEVGRDLVERIHNESTQPPVTTFPTPSSQPAESVPG